MPAVLSSTISGIEAHRGSYQATMESDGEFPPIHPRAPLNHAQADIEAQSSRMQSQSSHMTNDNPIYEKMGSATKNGNRRRKKYFCGICGLFILIFVVVLVLAIRADWFLVKNNNTLPTNSNQTKSSTYSQVIINQSRNCQLVILVFICICFQSGSSYLVTRKLLLILLFDLPQKAATPLALRPSAPKPHSTSCERFHVEGNRKELSS